MDLTTLIGLSLAFGAIVGGFLLEGGHVGSVSQPTAAIIVLGGTLGAAFVQFPGAYLKKALSGIKDVFFAPKEDLAEVIKQIVGFAEKARREGVVALESDAEKTTDTFLKKGLGLAVDGSESKVVRDALEVELSILAEEGESGAKVFEAAGGYAPTVGILGAVLGLIHVMENLADPSKLGAGIAVAFVATVYGVAIANLILLPMAGKIKVRHQHAMIRYEIIVAGIAAIVDGENPRLIERKLQGYLGSHGGDHGKVTPLKKAA